MSVLNDIFNFVKKYCNDDVCLMIVFVLLGFSLCYLFKDRISGYANFGDLASFEKTISDDKKPENKVPELKDEESIGQVLRPMKPEATPSTKRALEVMASKEPVNKGSAKQKVGLSTNDAMIFKPFDEVWNPGFMPLDMVFKNVQKDVKGSMVPSKMGPDRPTGQGSMPPPSPAQPSPSGGSDVNLVLVYAPWCGHSKRMLPDYERVKNEFDGKTINGKKVNVLMYTDEDKDKVKEYGVKGFPSLFVEKNGNRESFPHRTYDKISEYLNSL